MNQPLPDAPDADAAGLFRFRCSLCGSIHEGAPSFSFAAPAFVEQLTQDQKGTVVEAGSDLFRVRLNDRELFFLRVCLEVPIHGFEEPFLWGVWVSISEQSHRRVLETWDHVDESDSYFGWFSNRLPYYEDTLHLKTQVRPRAGGLRPVTLLEPTDHELAMDQQRGISPEKARRIAEICLHQAQS